MGLLVGWAQACVGAMGGKANHDTTKCCYIKLNRLQLGVGCPAERGLVGMWVGKGHGSPVTEVRPVDLEGDGHSRLGHISARYTCIDYLYICKCRCIS